MQLANELSAVKSFYLLNLNTLVNASCAPRWNYCRQLVKVALPSLAFKLIYYRWLATDGKRLTTLVTFPTMKGSVAWCANFNLLIEYLAFKRSFTAFHGLIRGNEEAETRLSIALEFEHDRCNNKANEQLIRDQSFPDEEIIACFTFHSCKYVCITVRNYTTVNVIVG